MERWDDYRFGFNTQEKVDEIAGIGNHTTALFWEYDTRLGRRWNLDPVFKEYESPYSTFGNNPILFTDWKGNDTTIAKPNGDDALVGDNISVSQDRKTLTNNSSNGNWKEKVWNDDELRYVNNESSSNSIIPSLSWSFGLAGEGMTNWKSTFRLTAGKGQKFSPKVYNSGWRGGSRARITTYKFSKVGNFLSKAGFGLGLAQDTYGLYNYLADSEEGYKVSPIKFSTNTAVGLYGLTGSIGGITASPIYFGFEAFYPGGMSQALDDKGGRDESTSIILSNEKQIKFNSFNLSENGGIFKQ